LKESSCYFRLKMLMNRFKMAQLKNIPVS